MQEGKSLSHLQPPQLQPGLCGGHKQVSQMLRNIYDMELACALRAQGRQRCCEEL